MSNDKKTYIVKVTHISRQGFETPATFEVDAVSREVAISAYKDMYPESRVEIERELKIRRKEAVPALSDIFRRALAS